MRFFEIVEAASPYLSTNEFKSWFAGSKVVDTNGKPRVVFHGTLEDFGEFKLESARRRAYGLNRLGYWFDVDHETPNYFATNTQGGGSVILAYLSIKKPLIYNSEPVWDEEAEILAKHAAAGDYRAFNKHVEQMDRQDSYDHLVSQIAPPSVKRSSNEFERRVERFRADAIAEGYDGIFLPETYADAGTRGGKLTDWWIAFHPSQIKAVLGNQGGFDPRNPDITK